MHVRVPSTTTTSERYLLDHQGVGDPVGLADTTPGAVMRHLGPQSMQLVPGLAQGKLVIEVAVGQAKAHRDHRETLGAPS